MDEPFAALDAQTRLLMQQQMRRIAHESGTPVLFITHDIDEAIALGTRIGVMKAGPESALKGIVDVNLGEERDRMSATYIEIYREVHQMIRDEVLRTVERHE
jgi:NitT/TauT family transport system ATP-binding protein